MTVNDETVRRVAFLSRIKIDDDKIEATKDEFNKILSWVDELNEVDTDNVKELISVNDEALRMREDKVLSGKQKDEVLANAPAAEYDYFAVPKVVE